MSKIKRTTKGAGAPTTMNKSAIRKNAKQVATPPYQYTGNIEILGVGQSLEDERFLEVAVGDKTALLDVDSIADPRSGELKKLTRLGEPLIKPASRSEFLARVHDAARAEPSFEVATKTGFYRKEFVLPEGLDPRGPANVARYFDERYAVYHRRLRQEGTVQGWLELARLCRGKSRLLTGLCLAVCGPVCGAFGDEPPGVQVVSEGGMGGTTIGRIVGTVWGGDCNRRARSVAGLAATIRGSILRFSAALSIRCSCSSMTCTMPARRSSRRFST
jgi:hypothetical protein